MTTLAPSPVHQQDRRPVGDGSVAEQDFTAEKIVTEETGAEEPIEYTQYVDPSTLKIWRKRLWKRICPPFPHVRDRARKLPKR
jgi:hypothetical protein